jgi:hypothetical protein
MDGYAAQARAYDAEGAEASCARASWDIIMGCIDRKLRDIRILLIAWSPVCRNRSWGEMLPGAFRGLRVR